MHVFSAAAALQGGEEHGGHGDADSDPQELIG